MGAGGFWPPERPDVAFGMRGGSLAGSEATPAVGTLLPPVCGSNFSEKIFVDQRSYSSRSNLTADFSSISAIASCRADSNNRNS